ncbi:hypothetical protein FNT36_19790 [Hymenobacter setariae]|uniref:Uncharacterized protein n=1 Tax=Hymenobacter setariae TaxID=2594794 RepID=A0A558BPI6_9BACT|nr:hypothetical protein [Hymenobacter setariae]TVT38435.1 hypothetical protein FNT36_19790 [Hymenobacter setariae]
MKTHLSLGAALLGLVLSSPAFAQADIPSVSSAPNAAGVPSIPAATIPGRPGRSTSTVPTVAPENSTRPTGITGSTYANGLPDRNIDGGTQRADQPRNGQAIPGAQPTKRLHKGQPRTKQPAF